MPWRADLVYSDNLRSVIPVVNIASVLVYPPDMASRIWMRGVRIYSPPDATIDVLLSVSFSTAVRSLCFTKHLLC